jgi:hypothetical protein
MKTSNTPSLARTCAVRNRRLKERVHSIPRSKAYAHKKIIRMVVKTKASTGIHFDVR